MKLFLELRLKLFGFLRRVALRRCFFAAGAAGFFRRRLVQGGLGLIFSNEVFL